MLSYKNWRMINEAILPNFSLGLATPTNLGISGSNLEEAKAKKMAADETGDGEMVDPASEKDVPECSRCGKYAKKKMKKAKKMWSDEDDAEEAPEEEVEETPEGDEEEVPEEDVPEEDVDSEEEVPEEDAEATEEPVEDEEVPMYSKKKSKKSKKKMKAEETEAQEVQSEEEMAWWNSVHSMTEAPLNQKYYDGYTEYQPSESADGLFTPINQDELGISIRQEPGTAGEAGQVGFAPQGRMGLLGGTFQEWVAKRT